MVVPPRYRERGKIASTRTRIILVSIYPYQITHNRFSRVAILAGPISPERFFEKPNFWTVPLIMLKCWGQTFPGQPLKVARSFALTAVCPTGQMRILQNQILGILFTQGSTLRALRQVRTFAGCQICIRADLSERTQISQDFAGFPIPMRLLLNCFSKMQSKGQNGR